MTAPLGAPRDVSLTEAGGIYVTGEDHLRVTTFNSAAGVGLAIEGRFLEHKGRLVAFTERHVPNTDRTSASSTFTLGEGFLLNVQIRASVGSPRRGQCFALLELVRGRGGAVVPLACLSQGYVTDTARRGWPGSPNIDSTEGPGVLRSVTGTDPAAGIEIIEVVPTNARWNVLGIVATLVTAVAAANRVAVLALDDGANVYARIQPSAVQTATNTHIYSGVPNGFTSAALATLQLWSLPQPCMLQGGHRIRTITTLIQAADEWSAPQMLVEEWIED